MTLLTEKRIKMEKAMQVFEAKEDYFIHNGVILQEKQISRNRQAANNYDPDLILGAKIGTVYKGKLDERQVANKVKGPLRLWSFEKTIDFFLNQVAIIQLISNNNTLLIISMVKANGFLS